MSNTVRTVAFATAFVLAAGASVSARQASDQAVLRNPLSIGMLADTSGAGAIEFRITNNSAETLKVPYWELPVGSGENRMFQVYQDGRPATYLGAMVKRGRPTDADFVTFAAYETKVFRVDLAEDYDLSRGGDFTVTFASQLAGTHTAGGRHVVGANGRMASLRSAPVLLWVDGKSATSQKQATANKGRPGGGTNVGGVTYVGCSTTQITDAGNGVAQARLYSQGARDYFSSHSSPTTRYTTCFVAYPSARFTTATKHFVAIDNALDQSNGAITINCGCNQNYYAYVYPTKPYEIFVCKAFWTAPTVGTDSKGGTLIHETSHFNVVAGTDDVVYGQSGAKSLALSDPDGALNNADSHEYFAENNPADN
jgi:peptidyl-Lys metalloendopeptidase